MSCPSQFSVPRQKLWSNAPGLLGEALEIDLHIELHVSRRARGLTLTTPISPDKHFTGFFLLLCLTSFRSCPIIGLMKKFHLQVELLIWKFLGTHLVWSAILEEEKFFHCCFIEVSITISHSRSWMLYIDFHFVEYICKRFHHFEIHANDYLPILYNFILNHHIISTNFCSDPHPKHDPSILQKLESLSLW